MNRGQEINERLLQIQTEIETRGENITAEELTAFETEVQTLTEERAELLKKAETRKNLLEDIASGNISGQVLSRGVFNNFGNNTTNNNEDDSDPLATQEYRKAFMNYVLRNKPIPKELRSDEVTFTNDIGPMIPTPVLNRIIEKLEATGMILPLVTRTNYRGGLRVPYSAVKPVATWVDEGSGSPTQKKTVKKIIFAYHKLRCAVAVTLEVDTMALSAFETALMNNVVEAMLKAIEQSIISGTGEGQPKGILEETPNTGQVLNVQSPSYQDLINAEAALPQAYENGAVWCMHKQTFMQYFGLLDTNGQPVGRVNMGIRNRPERFLLGRPVVVCEYINSIGGAANGDPFAFLFNFSDYILNTNLGVGIKRYVNDETDDIITRAVMLTDGMVVDNNSLVILQKSNTGNTYTENTTTETTIE